MTKDNLIFVIWFTLFMLLICTYGFYTDMMPLCDYLICLFLTTVSIVTAFFMRFIENDYRNFYSKY